MSLKRLGLLQGGLLQMAGIRLQKYLADAGVASRRKCEELISQGRVQVNGQVVVTPGFKISGNEDVRVDGRKVCPCRRKLYILLNKPTGFISSAKDQFSRKTVLDLVPEIKERIYPVGRLDYDTSGLIILTNDGEFANIVAHPRHQLGKTYRATVSGRLNEEDISKLENGLMIEDYVTSPAEVKVIKPGDRVSVVEITIHEGKNRQVRKMFEAIGHPVLSLKRTRIGPIGIEGLEEGKWRWLTRDEVNAILEASGEDVKSK